MSALSQTTFHRVVFVFFFFFFFFFFFEEEDDNDVALVKVSDLTNVVPAGVAVRVAPATGVGGVPSGSGDDRAPPAWRMRCGLRSSSCESWVRLRFFCVLPRSSEAVAVGVRRRFLLVLHTTMMCMRQ
jgi:hypothetical protein